MLQVVLPSALCTPSLLVVAEASLHWSLGAAGGAAVSQSVVRMAWGSACE